MKRSSIFAFLGGTALGVVAALLLAPESGRKTRKKLKRKLRKYSELGTDELEELVGYLKDHKKSIKNIIK